MPPSLSVLDVGHGNCAVLHENGSVAVIDAGPKSPLLEYLTSKKIEKIDALVISHADADHVAGIIAVLSSDLFEVSNIYINADQMKTSDLWEDVKQLLNDRHNSGRVEVRSAVSGVIKEWTGKSTALEVVAPSLYATLSGGPGSVASDGQRRDTNSSSVVLRILNNGKPIVFLGADMDNVTLADIVNNKREMKADFLIFPHHGGNPGSGNIADFSNSILSAVSPKAVIFSNGRGRFDNPRPEIISIIQDFKVGCIACTQLSKSCCDEDRDHDLSHLSSEYSSGAASKRSCAGTITINLDSTEIESPALNSHQEFVTTLPTPLCKSSQKSSNIGES